MTDQKCQWYTDAQFSFCAGRSSHLKSDCGVDVWFKGDDGLAARMANKYNYCPECGKAVNLATTLK